MATEVKTPNAEPPREPSGLRCPRCGCGHLPVLYTRHKRDHVLRVRHCRNCGRRVMTRERMN